MTHPRGSGTLLKPIRAGAVSTEFKQNHGDLWFEVFFKNRRPAFLWVLYEHQRDPDRWMALRFYEATSKLLGDWHDRHPRARWLPAIIPVVLYQGTRPWTQPTSLVELFDLSEEARRDLAPHLPSCSFVLDDLVVTEDREIVARPLDPEARLTLMNPEPGRKLEKQGYDRGIKEGVDLGLDKGVAKGQRALLLRLLKRRFGALPAAVTRRVARAGTAELERWSDRILDADSLDAVFAS